MGSGNVVNNLRGIDLALADSGFDWAQRFDQESRALMTDSPERVTGLQAHQDFRSAVPTPDHFLPLLYLAGLAEVAGRPADTLVDGYVYGSISMTSYTLDAGCQAVPEGDDGPAPIPDPEIVPADETNL